MRYLITKRYELPFYTNYFESENHFNKDDDMVVYDLHLCKFTTDGEIWHDIETDHL